jgi:AcrR family transcriptional regulator
VNRALLNKTTAMSRNDRKTAAKANAKTRRAPDIRIRRTRERLGAAMIALIQEKTIDEVSVQEVLDRAGVGRSTFYLHYRDKDDLLLSQLEVFLEMVSTSLIKRRDTSRRVLPVAEFFSHVGAQKKVYRALADSGRLPDFFDLAQEYFARGIEQRLKETKPVAALPSRELRARSSALAGSLISLFRWWMDHDTREPAEKMDALFHQMVWGSLR